jgi:hypothetical protein
MALSGGDDMRIAPWTCAETKKKKSAGEAALEHSTENA